MKFLSFLLIYLCTYHGFTEELQQPSILIRKPTLVISCGLAGIGKTTILRALASAQPNSVYIDKDTINQTLLHGHDYFSDYYDQYVRQQSYDVMLALAQDNLRLGSDKLVILDGYFGDKLQSSWLQSYLTNPDINVRIIYFSCSPEMLYQRLITRGEKRDTEKIIHFEEYYKKNHQIHEDNLSKMLCLRINTESFLQENLRIIQAYIKN